MTQKSSRKFPIKKTLIEPGSTFLCHLFFNLIPKINYMRKALERSEFKSFAKCFPESIIVVWYLVGILLLYFVKGNLKEFFDQLVVDWNGKKLIRNEVFILTYFYIIATNNSNRVWLKIKKDTELASNKLALICVIFLFIGHFNFFLLPFLKFV